MTKKQLAQNLDSLKASFDSNLNRVVQSVKSSNENFDAKINTLNQHVEALAETASLEAESMTQKELAQNVDSLKGSFDNNLNMVVQNMKSYNDTLNQNVKDEIGALKDEITAVKMLLEEEKKQKTLDRALKLAYHGSFKYYTSTTSRLFPEESGTLTKSFHGSFTYYTSPNITSEESGELAKSVIGWFLLGQGAVLPSDATLEHGLEGSFEVPRSYSNALERKNILLWKEEARQRQAEEQEKADASRKAFRAKLGLIMREPRVEKKNDGNFVIYYS
eukprot:scaffold2252_cov129-Skeletonema_dohrnii-CCMP3373.AAC.2